MIRPINLPDRPPPDSYSLAVEATGVTRMLFLSGQVGVDIDGSVPEDVADQTRIAVAKVLTLLDQAGMTTANIAKVSIFLTDESYLPGFMAGAGGTLPTPLPATTLLIVKALASPAMKVEIEIIAVA